MRLDFTKMQSLGNDFVVLDGVTAPMELSSEQVRTLADRHRGIGFDQLLLAERPSASDCDFRFRIFNADGGEVGQCGNGARCFARFLHEQNLTAKARILVETLEGQMALSLGSDNEVTVELGIPKLNPAQIPLLASRRDLTYSLEIEHEEVEIVAVNVGNPHAVQLVEDVDQAPVSVQGRLIERHAAFPERTNVGFLQVINRQCGRLRVYERGVGETLACGSGACASMIAGRLLGLLDSTATLSLPGGELRVDWEGEGQPVLLTGSATTVFHGEIEL